MLRWREPGHTIFVKRQSGAKGFAFLRALLEEGCAEEGCSVISREAKDIARDLLTGKFSAYDISANSRQCWNP